ncbi:MAG: hypothetical protein ACYC18_08735, partial [Gammaproteobacteria bacterium]
MPLGLGLGPRRSALLRGMKARIARRFTESLAGLPDGLHPVLRRVYAARRVRGPADLEHSLERLHPLTGLTGIASAAALLSEAVEQDRRILLVGDFDADGATSCALAVLALRALGARQVHYLVPNRFEF